MARRIAQSTLNASTLDILNVIRQNASLEYQASVPAVTQAADIPKVGEVIYGTPAFSNQFLNALVNRIATVRIQSANFNNPYSILKKGYLEFGETVEDIFVNIAQVVEYSAEKAEARELKRVLPDVRSAFHVMNWRVMYPVTIQDEDLKLAFLSLDGVTNLIANIVDQVYTAAEYDEFLLFKYLLIKSISHGEMQYKAIPAGDLYKQSAATFRGLSNKLLFMSKDYNEAGVKTNTPRDRQVIFMDADFNAQFDVNVLAAAFNMEKADFMGRLFLIDDFTSFDNERFEIIRANSDGLEEVSSTELALLANINAVILDENWFQVFDNNNKSTEKYVASGLYWNYFYHTWKTVSHSPFANAVAVVNAAANISALPATLVFTVSSVDRSAEAIVYTLELTGDPAISPRDYEFVTTSSNAAAGIAVQKYGAYIVPIDSDDPIDLEVHIGDTAYVLADGILVEDDDSGAAVVPATAAGDTITLSKSV